MKILDLINIMILNEFNQFKTLVKKKYDPYSPLILNVDNILYTYDFAKSYDECWELINKWIHYGLVKKDSTYYTQELAIRIYF
jgi:hypothetical protein